MKKLTVLGLTSLLLVSAMVMAPSLGASPQGKITRIIKLNPVPGAPLLGTDNFGTGDQPPPTRVGFLLTFLQRLPSPGPEPPAFPRSQSPIPEQLQ